MDAAGYWAAQVIGGILGALLLLWVMHGSAFYSKAKNGLGANGYGNLSLLHTSGGGAFLAEVILTAVFVLVLLSATRKEASAPVAGRPGRLRAGAGQHLRHPDRRRVGQPGPEHRAGFVGAEQA